MARAGFGDARIQTVDNEELGSNVVQISAEESGRTDQVTDALRSEFGVRGEPEVTEVGPTFGRTVANSALTAILASLSVISIYIAVRFEWKFAVPVLIALMHDVLITAGVYALVGREVTTSTVAALLTILGFSLYDTIIVFDRIRENVPRMPSSAFSQIVNRSMSEVIVRSLATSFCTILPVLALFLFGGDTLQDFAFALIIGTLSGAYSSVFIAGPVLVLWKEREPVYRTRRARIREQLGSVPAYARAARRRRAEAPPRGRPDHGGADGRRPWPPREAALMGALVWVMMGLALWHFAIFLPDRFWSGIIGAFLGALIGSLAFGLAINGFTVPGPNDTDLVTALEVIPGAIAGMAVVYVIGLRDAIRSGRSRCAGQRDGGGPRRSLR